jgi:hypothetical protein
VCEEGEMTEENKSTRINQTEHLQLTNRFTSAVDYARSIHIEGPQGDRYSIPGASSGVSSPVMRETGPFGFLFSEAQIKSIIK